MHQDGVVPGSRVGGNHRTERRDAVGPGGLVLHDCLGRAAPIEVDVSEHTLQQGVVLDVGDGGIDYHGRAGYHYQCARSGIYHELSLYAGGVYGIVLDLEEDSVGGWVLVEVEYGP